MSTQTPWYAIQQAEKIDSPAFVVYADRVRKNIATAVEMTGGPQRLRPHVKTHKNAEVTRLLLDAGITKFKCATIAEADMLGAAGAPDVLLAYQPVGPKAARFIGVVLRYPSTRFSCLVDNLTAAEELARLAVDKGLEIPVFIDLNVGMNRTGIKPDEKAVELFEKLLQVKGIKPVGLHAYDGHIADMNVAERTKNCNDAFAPVLNLKQMLEEKGHANISIVAGGSPTFPIHAKREGVECSPGTFVYWDAGYLHAFPDQPFLPATVLLTRVISLPGDNLLCTDLGHKSVAAENPLRRRVQFLEGAELEVVGQSEEHLMLKNWGRHPYIIGELLYGMPLHVCPTCALYETAVVVEKGEVTGEWKTVARDRKINV